MIGKGDAFESDSLSAASAAFGYLRSKVVWMAIGQREGGPALSFFSVSNTLHSFSAFSF